MGAVLELIAALKQVCAQRLLKKFPYLYMQISTLFRYLIDEVIHSSSVVKGNLL